MAHQELRGRDGADDEDRDLGEERKLARLEAVVLAEHQRDERRRGGDVPDPGERNVPLRPGHPHAAQPRHQIVAFADEEGGKRAEDHAVDVHRPQPAEGGFQAGAEIVGIVEEPRQQHAHRGGDQQPEHAPVEPCLERRASRPMHRDRRRQICHAAVSPSPPRYAPPKTRPLAAQSLRPNRSPAAGSAAGASSRLLRGRCRAPPARPASTCRAPGPSRCSTSRCTPPGPSSHPNPHRLSRPGWASRCTS